MIFKMTGFDAAFFFQTEQTVKRKKSEFRVARSKVKQLRNVLGRGLGRVLKLVKKLVL